ncbi:hypothetical protein DFJ73DRAFT_833474 [Zopfochytrium polystomum]|nr:hypothetical protein DFJ73DRAFT_833474 [Zopfochytrium polystomum]
MTTTTASGMAPLGAYLAASLDALFHLTVVAAGRSGEGDNQHHLDDSPPADASLDAFSVPLKLPSTLPERVADDDPSADTLLLAASTAIASAPFFSLSSATLLTIAASYSVAIPDRLFDARGTGRPTLTN